MQRTFYGRQLQRPKEAIEDDGRIEGQVIPDQTQNDLSPIAQKAENMFQMIGPEQVHDAEAILKKYKEGKSALDNRIVENEKWFRMRHWEVVGHSKNPGDPEPKSGWLFNSLANKHADAMDNYPTLAVLPREEADKPDADSLSSILPTVLEQCEFEQVYDRMWWYKLKSGTGVTGVFWDNTKLNGLGDIDIRVIDVLNLFWEPGIKDIQRSRHLFHVELHDREAVEERYPQLKKEGAAAGFAQDVTIAQYAHDDTIDTSNKCTVVDWYYKIKSPEGKTIVHYCKFCSGVILYASQNDPAYSERGFYDHGMYPFEFDVLFPLEDSPAGFGYVDVCKSEQIYIDKLDQALLKNTIIGARPRYWVKGDGSVNEKEYADITKDFVHFTGSGKPEESIYPVQIPQLNTIAVTMRGLKVDELKEVSGNRDFSQGGTSAGVTAASAIAALQEAGSKLSRDMIKASYRSFAQVGYLCIELIRQFYTEPRMFRIMGQKGGMDFVEFSGEQIAPKQIGDGFMEATRMPYFDIKVVAQKSSPFSTVAQNERAKELYQMGFFRPDNADQSLMALEMMQFEGIDALKQKIAQNGTLFQKMQQLAPLVLAMAQQLDAVQGTQYTPQIAQILGMGMSAGPMMGGGAAQEVQTNGLGDVLSGARKTTAGEARKQAASAGTPR